MYLHLNKTPLDITESYHAYLALQKVQVQSPTVCTIDDHTFTLVDGIWWIDNDDNDYVALPLQSKLNKLINIQQ